MALSRAAVICLFFALTVLCVDLTIEYPNVLTDGPVEVETVSREYNLDGPKIPGTANDTTYDW